MADKAENNFKAEEACTVHLCDDARCVRKYNENKVKLRVCSFHKLLGQI